MFCKKCGKEISNKAIICVHCGLEINEINNENNMSKDTMRLLLPVDRSVYAMIAGYMGLLSVLGIFAPFALIFGILGIIDINKHQEKCGMGRSIFGIIMGGFITLMIITGILVS